MTDLESRVQTVIQRARVPNRAAAEVLADLAADYVIVPRDPRAGKMLYDEVMQEHAFFWDELLTDEQRANWQEHAVSFLSRLADLARNAPAGEAE